MTIYVCSTELHKLKFIKSMKNEFYRFLLILNNCLLKKKRITHTRTKNL